MNKDSNKLKEAIEKIKGFKTSANNVIVTYVKSDSDTSVSDDYFVVKDTDFLKERHIDKTFYYSIQGFFQNNTIMAKKMQVYVNNLLKNYETNKNILLDLYAGVGTFGIINSDLFKDVLILESVKECIDAAEKNIKTNNVENVKALLLDAKNLKKLELKNNLFVITDPPRSGMHPKTIEELNRIKPLVIIYVSCNIEQLSKDLLKFKSYKLNSVALFDLFPQTNHVEAVVELVLS